MTSSSASGLEKRSKHASEVWAGAKQRRLWHKRHLVRTISVRPKHLVKNLTFEQIPLRTGVELVKKLETQAQALLNLLLATVYSRQTSECPSDYSTESSVSDDLVESVTDRRQSDVDVDIKSHFRLHLRAQRQPTGCQQYWLTQFVQ